MLTGPGLSADSGLATFRGPGGQWRKYRPVDLATPAAFERDPYLVWDWYNARRLAAGECEPNEAHLAMARFAQRRDDVVIITQNVDGPHTRAAAMAAREPQGRPGRGFREEQALPLELHGSFLRARCVDCGRRRDHRDPIDAKEKSSLPRCQACGGLQRPDVVWFGEPLGEAIDRAFGCAAEAEVCLVVGTSAVVQPAASVAMVTRRAGGVIIEVNPEETPLTPMSEVSIRSTALETVPRILAPRGAEQG